MTLDGFRDVTETPISLDFSNSWIADIRLNAGDKDGRTITVAITDNGQPITSTTGIKSVALAYNTAPGVEVGDRVTMSPVSGEATATYRATLPRRAIAKPGVIALGVEVTTADGAKICSRNSRASSNAPYGTPKAPRGRTASPASNSSSRTATPPSSASITPSPTRTTRSRPPTRSSRTRASPAATPPPSTRTSRPRPRCAAAACSASSTCPSRAARASPAPAPPPWTPTSPPPPACCRPEARATTR